MSKHPIGGAELARLLDVPESHLSEIAAHCRLGFSVSSAGFEVETGDIDLWRAASARLRNSCLEGDDV